MRRSIEYFSYISPQNTFFWISFMNTSSPNNQHHERAAYGFVHEPRYAKVLTCASWTLRQHLLRVSRKRVPHFQRFTGCEPADSSIWRIMHYVHPRGRWASYARPGAWRMFENSWNPRRNLDGLAYLLSCSAQEALWHFFDSWNSRIGLLSEEIEGSTQPERTA